MENEKLVSATVSQAEDKAFKTAAQFFAEELLPYFHVEGKFLRILPTEIIRLEARQLIQDFNFEMFHKRRFIAHFEFQSTPVTEDDLRRFREYEAATSRQHRIEVITYVVFSGKIKDPLYRLRAGINKYEIVPIVLNDDNADEWIGKIKDTMNKGILPEEKDLVPLMLTPLMSGESTQMERFSFGFDVLRQVEKVHESNLKMQKMQAVFYTFANKFLKAEDLNRVKEMISMTVLGEMLMNDGIKKGMERGREQGISALIQTCHELNASRSFIKGKIIIDFGLSADKAEEYMLKYWK